ncbi:MAG: hypothetical protein WBE58_22475 [Verrucomicrobiales bacterium]
MDHPARNDTQRLPKGVQQRHFNPVHGDVRALLNAGLLDKAEEGKIVFPYDAIHVDFLVKAA